MLFKDKVCGQSLHQCSHLWWCLKALVDHRYPCVIIFSDLCNHTGDGVNAVRCKSTSWGSRIFITILNVSWETTKPPWTAVWCNQRYACSLQPFLPPTRRRFFPNLADVCFCRGPVSFKLSILIIKQRWLAQRHTISFIVKPIWK